MMRPVQAVTHGVLSGPFIVYLLFPLDLIPDFIPMIGQADDGAAVGMGLLINVIVFYVFQLNMRREPDHD